MAEGNVAIFKKLQSERASASGEGLRYPEPVPQDGLDTVVPQTDLPSLSSAVVAQANTPHGICQHVVASQGYIAAPTSSLITASSQAPPVAGEDINQATQAISRAVPAEEDVEGKNALKPGPKDPSGTESSISSRESSPVGSRENSSTSLVPHDEGTCSSQCTVKTKSKKYSRCLGTLAFIIFLAMLPFVISALLCKILHSDKQDWKSTRALELLKNTTILAYNGTSTSVQIRASCESDCDAASEVELTLISIDCGHLSKHEHLRNVSLISPFSSEVPLPLPPRYNHYELWSTFAYNILLLSAVNTSELVMRIFNNTVEADNYISDHKNTSAQNKAILTKKVEANMPTKVSFNPSYASYFIPTFSADSGTQLNITYTITKSYYEYKDYVVYLDMCHLNATAHVCHFKRALNESKMCVLAYYPLNSLSNAPRFILTPSIRVNDRRHTIPQHNALFITSLSLLGIFTLIFVLICPCCLYSCRKSGKNGSENNVHQMVSHGSSHNRS